MLNENERTLDNLVNEVITYAFEEYNNSSDDEEFNADKEINKYLDKKYDNYSELYAFIKHNIDDHIDRKGVGRNFADVWRNNIKQDVFAKLNDNEDYKTLKEIQVNHTNKIKM